MTHPYMQYVEKGLNLYVHQAMSAQRKYINEFFNLKCAPDLLQLRVFPDAKEITETMAAYNAYRKCCRKRVIRGNDNLIIHVVGDGSTPRTAAYFAYLTSHSIYSIDPQMKDVWVNNNEVNRLHCFRSKIEDVHEHLPIADLVILVHAHVSYGIIRSLYSCPIISMPCCVAYPEEGTVKCYTDHSVWSPCNKVYIYPGIM